MKDSSIMDKPKEECGVIGIYAPNEDVARMAFFGLFALQHRGQEAAGIAVSDGRRINCHKDVGLVSNVFNPQNLAPLQGDFAIGHVRYSTTGSSTAQNAQPMILDTQHGSIALGHNGNIVNASTLRKKLLENGVGLSSSSDSEVIAMMLAGASGDNWFERLKDAMRHWVGAYSLVLLTKKQVFAVRDPWGFRPLSVGLLPSGGHAVASESGALRNIGCEAVREVKPGEIVALSDTALSVNQALEPKDPSALCTFEQIYFARPDNFWDGKNVHQIREALGEQLARESGIDADLVIPVPDSSIPAAIGYARESKIPFNNGFIKNRYIGRTFIQPTDSLRKQGVSLKLNVINENVIGKRLIVIDDSIVRGTTSGPLVKLLRDAGAKEVHLRITCPPIKHPCFMGVDMGSYDELIAHRLTIPQICEHIGADSLEYITVDGMMKAINSRSGYCNACFTGKYPFDINHRSTKTGFEEQES